MKIWWEFQLANSHLMKGSVRYRWNSAIKESNSFDRRLDDLLNYRIIV